MNQNDLPRGRSPTASIAKNTPATQVESVYLLPRQTPRFFGREIELKSLKQSLKSHDSVTISGIAGIGKTSIALHFAHQSLSEYNVILWMRSDGTTSLDQSCQESLHGLGLIEEAEKPGVESRRKWREHLSQAGNMAPISLPGF